MKTKEFIELLQMMDPEKEVVINPDIPSGKFKNRPGDRTRRYSYSPDSEITERTIMINGLTYDVNCIALGEDMGPVNPVNRI